MSVRTGLMLLALALTAPLSGDRSAPGAGAPRGGASAARIRFHIVTVEEKGDERHVVSEAAIEGPPGTDFNINLQGERFRMKARFLTDRIRPDALRLRARLDTRRLYGYSERDLPLYEEDEQRQSLELGFDEAAVLLPFGRGGGDHRLKIEITPALSEQAAGSERPLEISVLKPGPGGMVSFEASKIPHHFAVEAALLEDGREVARGAAPLLIEERQEIALQPEGGEGTAHPLVVNLFIGRYVRSRPADQVAFGFDLYRADDGARATVEQGWAGITYLGSDVTYDLGDTHFGATGKKYELKFRFKLAPGEPAD